MPKDEKDHIYRVVELAGTSGKSIEDAIAQATLKVGFTMEEP
jgi:flavin-binding protein dodecin